MNDAQIFDLIESVRSIAIALEELRRPSNILKPRLKRTDPSGFSDSERWNAVFVCSNHDGSLSVSAFGASPAEAYRNFDQVFYGTMK